MCFNHGLCEKQHRFIQSFALKSNHPSPKLQRGWLHLVHTVLVKRCDLKSTIYLVLNINRGHLLTIAVVVYINGLCVLPCLCLFLSRYISVCAPIRAHTHPHTYSIQYRPMLYRTLKLRMKTASWNIFNTEQHAESIIKHSKK